MRRPNMALLLSAVVMTVLATACAPAAPWPPLVAAPLAPSPSVAAEATSASREDAAGQAATSPRPVLGSTSSGAPLAATPLAAPAATLDPGARVTVTLTVPGISAQPLSSIRSGIELFGEPTARATPQLLGDLQQTTGIADASLSPFILLFPELRRLPAPGWLQEGQRTTYYVQSATIAQWPGDEGSGGAGFLQHDLVALSSSSAAVSSKFYLDEGGGKLTASSVTAAYGLPAVGDYWLNPVVLANAERAASNELAVLHMPTTLGGRSYDAVRFQYKTDQAEYVWMFDEVTGVLLFYRHTIGTENDRYRQAADITLVHQRQLSLPWRGQSVPNWAAPGTKLTYEGSWATLIAGSPASSLPYAVIAEITRAQPRWTAYTASDYLYGRLNGSGERVTGVGQVFDGLWLPSEALAGIQRGTWRDTDPVTGAELVLTRYAGGTIVMTESGPTYETTLTFDGQTGALLSVMQSSQVGLATNIIQLTLAE